ncbi:Serpentine receptor class X [Dirofilaria immitis]
MVDSLSLFILILTAFPDVITLIKIIIYRKTIGRNTIISICNIVKERDIVFFKQSCLLSFISVSCIILLTIHSFLFTNKWLLFASSTIAWILMQSVDGIILLIFNRNIIWKTNSWATSVTPTTNFCRLRAIVKYLLCFFG